jgi:hypothetical protein
MNRGQLRGFNIYFNINGLEGEARKLISATQANQEKGTKL